VEIDLGRHVATALLDLGVVGASILRNRVVMALAAKKKKKNITAMRRNAA